MIRFPKSYITNGSHLVFRHSLIAIALLSLVVTVLAPPAQAAAGLFQRGKSVRVGAEPFGLAVGDFNGDGTPDLVTANILGNNVSVLLGNGDGTFRPAVNYGAGERPIDVAVGELNNDGKLDLAVGNNSPSGSTGATVLLGNGDGTFGAPTSYRTEVYAFSIAIGDFNGDGAPDLVVANSYLQSRKVKIPTGIDGQLSVLLGNGDGTFRKAGNYDAGKILAYVAVGDFNGDGKLDLAVSNCGTNNVSVLLGNGDGTFQTAVNYTTGMCPTGVRISDFDGDGHLDMAVANFTSSNVVMLLGNGDGTFQQARGNNLVGLQPYVVAAGDFDRDGKLDLAVAGSGASQVTVLRGRGNGAFYPKAQNYAMGPQDRAVVAVDLNADGKLDLAVANGDNNTVSVMLGR